MAARVNSGSADEAQQSEKASLFPLTVVSRYWLWWVMATSSSDGSCTAPADFQLSSELEDVSNRLNINSVKCPLCHNNRQAFYCRQCIQNGDFMYSTSVYSERCVCLYFLLSVTSTNSLVSASFKSNILYHSRRKFSSVHQSLI